MRIRKKEIRIFLDQEGEAVMRMAAVDLTNPIYVNDTDDMGIRVEVERNDGKHVVLIRWDYVLSLDSDEVDNEAGF
jgi:hypothetical protein